MSVGAEDGGEHSDGAHMFVGTWKSLDSASPVAAVSKGGGGFGDHFKNQCFHWFVYDNLRRFPCIT